MIQVVSRCHQHRLVAGRFIIGIRILVHLGATCYIGQGVAGDDIDRTADIDGHATSSTAAGSDRFDVVLVDGGDSYTFDSLGVSNRCALLGLGIGVRIHFVTTLTIQIGVDIGTQLLARRGDFTIWRTGNPVAQAVSTGETSRISQVDGLSVSGILFGFR